MQIVLDYTDSCFEVRVMSELDANNHTMFLGEVVNAKVISDEQQMTYEFYHQINRGTTPMSVLKFVQAEKQESTDNPKYVCSVCGYVYDPILGDPDSNVQPETPFEKLPETWACPVCGATKDRFERKK